MSKKEGYVSPYDKRKLIKGAVKEIKGIEVTVKPLDEDNFVAKVGRYTITIPYHYWEEWTLLEIIQYIMEMF